MKKLTKKENKYVDNMCREAEVRASELGSPDDTRRAVYQWLRDEYDHDVNSIALLFDMKPSEVLSLMTGRTIEGRRDQFWKSVEEYVKVREKLPKESLSVDRLELATAKAALFLKSIRTRIRSRIQSHQSLRHDVRELSARVQNLERKAGGPYG